MHFKAKTTFWPFLTANVNSKVVWQVRTRSNVIMKFGQISQSICTKWFLWMSLHYIPDELWSQSVKVVKSVKVYVPNDFCECPYTTFLMNFGHNHSKYLNQMIIESPYTTLLYRLHYHTLQYNTLHYTTLLSHYTTLLSHYTTLLSHYITCYATLHYTTLHCTALHCTTLHYTTLHNTTLHYTTLHYTTPHYRKIIFC